MDERIEISDATNVIAILMKYTISGKERQGEARKGCNGRKV